jgi:hypothetical protein
MRVEKVVPVSSKEAFLFHGTVALRVDPQDVLQI